MSSVAVKTTQNSSRNLIRRRHFKELVDRILLMARFKGASSYRNYTLSIHRVVHYLRERFEEIKDYDKYTEMIDENGNFEVVIV